jgi:hypothetical protein
MQPTPTFFLTEAQKNALIKHLYKAMTKEYQTGAALFYEEKFRGKRNFQLKMKTGSFVIQECDYLLPVLINNVPAATTRESFGLLFGNPPEVYGYTVPEMELPKLITRTLKDTPAVVQLGCPFDEPLPAPPVAGRGGSPGPRHPGKVHTYEPKFEATRELQRKMQEVL